MKISSPAALESAIKSRLPNALEIAEMKVFKLLTLYLQRYYAAYAPIEYERTYQLMSSSLYVSPVSSGGNSFTAKVYYDPSALDYSFRLRGGVPVPKSSGWTGEEVLDAAAHGWHGNVVYTVGIYDDPVLELYSGEMMKIFTQALKAAGIPAQKR